MKTRLFLFSIALAGAFALSLNSCTKEPATSLTSDDQLTATQTMFAENMINDDASYTDDSFVTAGTLKAGDANGGVKHPMGPNATTTFTHKGDSIVKVIDFGLLNGLCNDGRIRRGRITVTHFIRPTAHDTSYMVSYSDFGVNDNKIEGKTVVVYNGLNTLGQPSWTITFTKTITTKAGNVMNWTGTRTRTMTAGYATKTDWTDDVFELTGNAKFTNAKTGMTRTITITSPLVRKATCSDFGKGIIVITRTGKSDMTIDFGNGDCDNVATLLVDGVTTTIKI
jgi:hypothetical protein